MQIELVPFLVPDSIEFKISQRPKQDGIMFMPKIPLLGIDANTLSDMCDEFRKSVFLKSGKLDPREIAIAKAEVGINAVASN